MNFPTRYRGAVCCVALAALTVPMAPLPSEMRHGGAGRHVHTPESPQLRKLRTRANHLLREASYERAAELYRAGVAASRSNPCKQSAVRLLLNLGSANYKMHRYGDALRAYIDARQFAGIERERDYVGISSVNLSSLYLQLGALDLAVETARQGLEDLRDADGPYRVPLLIHAGQLQAMKQDFGQASKYLQEAISAAKQQGDPNAEARALTEMGNTLLAAKSPVQAVAPLERAVALRLQNEDPAIYFSYEALGRAWADQGDYKAAREVLTQGIESARQSGLPDGLWSCYYARGEANLADHRIADAYRDLSQALAWARRWKAEVLPADVFRVSSSVQLHQIYAAYLDAAMGLYRQTGRRSFAEDAFGGVEEIRAQSLRALRMQGDAWLANLPAAYWETLAQLQAAERAALHDKSASLAESATRLRAALSEMEARAGLDAPAPKVQSLGRGLVSRVRGALSPSEAYFGFHLGDGQSYLYALSREAFEIHPLPAREQIAAEARDFSRAVATGAPTSAQRGAALFRQLFGSVGAQLRNKPQWILGLDGALFDVPFAALVEEQPGASPVYAVERHAIQVTPSAFAVLQDADRRPPDGPFVGFGDPVYNSADPRWRKPENAPRFAGLSVAILRRPQAVTQQLARLPGSGREVQQCARRWQAAGAAVLLTGASATKTNLVSALKLRPSVLHIAAHVIVPEGAGPAMIATGLGESGEVDYLSASEIANLRTRMGLVILNGCASGSGAILPGEGLMGLTRAWMAAGARAVIASRWPVSDGSGVLFEELYAMLDREQARGSVSLALQRAQLKQLRSGGPRANPSRWATYFCFERN